MSPPCRPALLSESDGVTVEKSPLALCYTSVAGGQVRKDTELHLRNQMELVLIAHKMPSDGKAFACNRRVIPDDLFGLSRGPFPMAKQIMHMKTLPNGAPNGGPRCTFPPSALTFLIAR